MYSKAPSIHYWTQINVNGIEGDSFKRWRILKGVGRVVAKKLLRKGILGPMPPLQKILNPAIIP